MAIKLSAVYIALALALPLTAGWLCSNANYCLTRGIACPVTPARENSNCTSHSCGD
jgi:hypothetical protein